MQILSTDDENEKLVQLLELPIGVSLLFEWCSHPWVAPCSTPLTLVCGSPNLMEATQASVIQCAAAILQVKLFVELFNSKYQALFFKLLRAGSEDEVTELAKQLEHNLEVRLFQCCLF